MAKTDNQQVKRKRDEIMARMQERFPDRKFAPSVGENGEIGENGEDNEELEQAVLETLDSLQSERDAYNAKSAALTKLFYDVPYFAEFVNRTIETRDMRRGLIETFGKEEISNWVSDESDEGIAASNKAWTDRRDKNAALDAEADTNWDKSLAECDSWGDTKGLSIEQKSEIMVMLIGITANGLVNKYGTDAFEMVYKAMQFDSAISDARNEGLVAGRNAKIDENKMRRQAAQAMPPALNGQGGSVKTPQRDNKPFWHGIE